eukprot:g5662.t1
MFGCRFMSFCTTSTWCRYMSSRIAPMLLRDFIHQQLYDAETGYFAKHVNIGVENNTGLPEPLNFNSILDESSYRLKIKKLYKRVPGSWLTPVEIFSPWYGNAIADFIIKRAKDEEMEDRSLEIFEIGGGSGTCMADILNRIKTKRPSLYNITKYTCIEISPRLAEAQVKKAKSHSFGSDHWEVICADFLELNEVLPQTKDLSFVLAFEVLDNLPHDKVIFDDEKAPWEAIIMDAKAPWRPHLRQSTQLIDFIMSFGSGERKRLKSSFHQEAFRRVSDALIAETLELMDQAEAEYIKDTSAPVGFIDKILQKTPNLRYSKTGVLSAASAIRAKQGIVYVPTGLLKFLKVVKQCIPKHALILSDFDALPGYVLPGASGPAIQSLGPSNRLCERSSYLLDGISADIFFPTDFIALKYMYKAILNKTADVYSAEEFFSPFVESMDSCRTISGYCPLVEDYKNTSFLIS